MEGPGEVLAVGNGDHDSVAAYRGNTRGAYEGTLLAIVQAGEEAGTIRVTGDLQVGETVIEAE